MKKFIVTISEGWNGLHFEFSKQDDAELYVENGAIYYDN